MLAVRQAQLEDLARVDAIVRAAARHLAGSGIDQWDDLYPSEALLREDIERRELWVVEHHTALAGLVTLNEFQSPEYAEVAWRHAGRVLVVHRLTVDPAHQGRGLAAALMAFAEQRAVDGGFDAIRLDVFTRNPAATALYEGRGYRRAGTVRFRKGEFLCFERPVP
jgi:ribosomal protein S18 acetylase RimI-like enzyme